MRVAIVHDWLYVLGGAEKVLQQLLICYPQADVFTLFDGLSETDRAKIGIARPVRTSFLQKIPRIARYHRSLLPLMPLAIEQLDLSDYDLVISSSYAVAKGVLTGPDQVHVSYVHSPMRYAWDLQHRYLADSGNTRGLKSALMRYFLHRLRIWDYRTGAAPDVMIANSGFIARRIRKSYGRTAEVIYPPVDLSISEPRPKKRHFLAASRLVPYKNIGAIVEAFSSMPDLELVVAGSGPEKERIAALAGPNVRMAGFVSDEELRELMATARAFVFAAEEDFGIITVEAQSEGTPVLALGRGGSRETVSEGQTGHFFEHATPAEIAACVRRFIADEESITPAACQAHARQFSAERFRREIVAAVDAAFAARRARPAPRAPAVPLREAAKASA